MKKAVAVLNKIYCDLSFQVRISPNLFPTSISFKQGKYLASRLSELKPNILLELGFGYGVSALWFQSSLHSPKSHIIVDASPQSAEKNVLFRLLNKEKNVTFEHKTSQVFLANYLQDGNKADMVFVDADERFDGFMTDMYFISKILQPNGTVIVRNVWNPSARKGLMFYIKNLPYTVANVSAIENRVIKKIPVLGGAFLAFRLKRLDFCELRLTGNDERPWNHFTAF